MSCMPQHAVNVFDKAKTKMKPWKNALQKHN